MASRSIDVLEDELHTTNKDILNEVFGKLNQRMVRLNWLEKMIYDLKRQRAAEFSLILALMRARVSNI